MNRLVGIVKKVLPSIFILIALLSACAVFNQDESISVILINAGITYPVKSTAGTSVEQLLKANNITLNPSDRIIPPLNTVLLGGETIQLVRVTEEFSVIESVLEFEQQTIKNESLPEGQTVLIQSGVNGLVQTTYRIQFENGVEVSRSEVKREIIQPAKPEILMIGVQSPFSAVEFEGLIAYISSSNAWIMEGNTGNRRVVTVTGDLDGRIFSISPDREWLLYSRAEGDMTGEHINSLWIVNLGEENPVPIATQIEDVVHFADWIPGNPRAFMYSTVEPRTTAPGWQANNDLRVYEFSEAGKVINDEVLVGANSGGLYGWWGTTYRSSLDGSRVAYSRPDSIGLVNLKTGKLQEILQFIPYQPKTDWAWVPGISWSPDGNILFTSINNKNPLDPSVSEYDLSGLLVDGGQNIPLVTGCGLFCYAAASQPDESGKYYVSYLSAITPDQSETSKYNLNVMDRDGSNRKRLYPGEGLQGLDPQFVAWSPSNTAETGAWLGFVANGNMLLAHIPSGSIKQITGDGSISKIYWR